MNRDDLNALSGRPADTTEKPYPIPRHIAPGMTENDFVWLCRKKLRLTQSELAGLLGIKNPRTIRKWEQGESDIPWSAILALGLMVSDFKTFQNLPQLALEKL